MKRGGCRTRRKKGKGHAALLTPVSETGASDHEKDRLTEWLRKWMLWLGSAREEGE